MKLQYIQHSVPNRVHSSYYSSKEVKLVYNSVQVRVTILLIVVPDI